jgi:hypothetical protein
MYIFPKNNKFVILLFNLRDENIFYNNPLRYDKNVHKEIERYQEARIEKKLTNLLQEKGFNNITQVKEVATLLRSSSKKYEAKGFKFELQSKSKSLGFDQFKNNPNNYKYFKNPKNPQNSLNISNDYYFKAKKQSKLPLFCLEIKVDDIKKETIEFFASDDPIVVSENFCLKYGLEREVKIQIQNLIDERLKNL